MVGALVGTTDVGLSDLGRHQAEAIRAYLEDAPVDAIVSSPRKRSLDTIAPLARAKNMKLDVRKGFAEMDFGQWEGLHWKQVLERDAKAAQEWEKSFSTVPPPGGESGEVFAARIHAALSELLAEFKGRSVILAGHAGTNRAILSHVLRRPYVDSFAFAQDYGCVNAVGWSAQSGFGQIALVNFVPGPRAKNQGD